MIKFCPQCRTPLSKDQFVCQTCGERLISSFSGENYDEISNYIEDEFSAPLSVTTKKQYARHIALSAIISLMLLFLAHYVFELDLALKPIDWINRRAMTVVLAITGVVKNEVF